MLFLAEIPWTASNVLPMFTPIPILVGLAGEVRAVNMAEQRVLEAAKLGFKRCILPKVNCRQLALTKEQTRGLELVGIESIHELLEVF